MAKGTGGGKATHSGTDYQNRCAGWFGVRILAEKDAALQKQTKIKGDLDRSYTLLKNNTERLRSDARQISRMSLARRKMDISKAVIERSLKAGNLDLIRQTKRANQAKALSLSLQQTRDQLNGTIGTMAAPIASAFASQRGHELDAIDFGLRGVEPLLKEGKLPSRQAVQGLADAVSVGIMRKARLRHPGGVAYADFNRSGTRVITCGHSRFAYIWDTATYSVIQRIDPHDFVYQSDPLGCFC